MEEIWIIPLSTLLSIVVLFLLSRLIGCRQVSELNLFDYINSITIGSLAADLTQATDETIVY